MCRGKRKKFRLKNIRRLFCLCVPLGDKRTDAYVKENIEVPLCSPPTRSDDPEVCVDDNVCALGQDASSPEPKAQVHDDDEDCLPRQWIPKRRLLTTDMPPDALLVIVMPDVCMDSIPVWGQRDIPACIFTWPSTKSGTLSCMYGYPTSLLYYAICLWQLYLLWQAHTQTGSNLCHDITLSGIAILKNFLMVAMEFRHIKDIRKTLINNHYIIHAFVVFVPAHPALYKAIFGDVYYRMITYSYRVPNVGIQNMDITVDRYGDMKLNYFVLPQSRGLPLHCPGRIDPSSTPSSHGQHIPCRCSIHAARRPVELPRWKLTMYKDILPSRVEVLPYSSPMQASGTQVANGQLVPYTGPTQVVTARLSELPRLNLMFYKDIISSSVQVFPCSSPLQASFIEPSHGQLVAYTGTMQANTRHITPPKLKLMFHEDNVSSFVEIFTCSHPMEALIMQSSSHGEFMPYAGPAQVTSCHIRLPRLKLMFHEDDVSFSVKLFPGSGHMETLIMQSSHRELVPYAGPAQVTFHHIRLPRLKQMFHENDVSFSVKLFPGSGHMEALIMQSSSHRELVRYAGSAQVTSRHIRLPRMKLKFHENDVSFSVKLFPGSGHMEALTMQSYSHRELVPYAGLAQVISHHIRLPRLKLIFHEYDVSFSVKLFPGSGHMEALTMQSYSHREIVPYASSAQVTSHHIRLPRLKLMFQENDVSFSVKLFPGSGHMEALIMQSSRLETVPYARPAQVTSHHIRLPRLKLVFYKGNVSSSIQRFPCSSPSLTSIVESSDGEIVPYTGPTHANIHYIVLPKLKLMFQETDVSFSVELSPGSGHMRASNIQCFHEEIMPYTGPIQANARHIAPPRLELLFYKHMLSPISQLLSSSCTILPRRRHLSANRSSVQATVRPTARVQFPQRRQLLAHGIAIHLWPEVIHSGRHNDDNSGDDCVAKDIAPDVNGFISTGRDDANDATDTDGDSEYKKGGMTSSSEVPVANTYKSGVHGNFICHMDKLDKQPPVKHAPLVKKHPKAILQEASDPPPQEQMQNEIAALLTVADIQSPSQETSTDIKIPSHVSSLGRSEKDEDVDTKLGDGDRCKTGLYEQLAYSLGAAPLFFLHVQITPHLGEDRTKLHDTAFAICCLAFSTTQNPRRWDEKQLNLMVADSAGIQATILQYTKKLNCDIDQLPQDLKVIFESLPCGPQSLRLGVKNVISGSLDNSPSRYYVHSAPDGLLTSLRLIFKLFFNIGAVMWCADTVYAIMRVKLNKIADYKEDRVAILTCTQNDVVMYFFEDLAGCVEFIKCQFEKTENFQLLPVYKYASYLHHAMRYFKTA